MDLVEDAVDELAGFQIAEFLGQFHGFVDGHLGRDIVGVQQLINAQTQDIAVDDRHAFDLPVGGIVGNLGVDRREICRDTVGKTLREFPDNLIRRVLFLPELRGGRGEIPARHLGLIKDL